MVDALLLRDVGASSQEREAAPAEAPDLVEWLRSGRLTLIDSNREPIGLERWGELSGEVRARALADFQRIVRGSTKAAVIFLR
jgi:hypothetical protein